MGSRGASSGRKPKSAGFTVPDMTHMKRSEMNRAVRDVWNRYMNDKATTEEVYAYRKAYNDKTGGWTREKSEELNNIRREKEIERQTNKNYSKR